jgi:hypothetical protein
LGIFGLSAGMCARSVIATQCLHGLRAAGHGLDQRQEGHVEEQHLVFGVVGDVGDLVRVQARVHGVQHRARAADREVQLHVAVAVPGQRGDAVAGLDASAASALATRRERAGHLLVGGAVDVAFDAPRHDLAVGVVPFGVDDEGGNQQRLLHHLAEHGGLLVAVCHRAERPRREAGFCGMQAGGPGACDQDRADVPPRPLDGPPAARHVDRLGDIVVHARGQAGLAVLGHRVGGHRDDGHPRLRAGSARMARVAATPSSSGICMSISTRS